MAITFNKLSLTPKPINPLNEFFIGDIAISYDYCRNESKKLLKDFSEYVTHLLLHGFLHLMGFDHKNISDSIVMERNEVQILKKMGIDNHYIL